MQHVAGYLLLGGGSTNTIGGTVLLGNLDVEVQPAYDVELGVAVIEVETVDPLTVCQPG